MASSKHVKILYNKYTTHCYKIWTCQEIKEKQFIDEHKFLFIS